MISVERIEVFLEGKTKPKIINTNETYIVAYLKEKPRFGCKIMYEGTATSLSFLVHELFQKDPTILLTYLEGIGGLIRRRAKKGKK